jgi:hypothetical protein
MSVVTKSSRRKIKQEENCFIFLLLDLFVRFVLYNPPELLPYLGILVMRLRAGRDVQGTGSQRHARKRKAFN